MMMRRFNRFNIGIFLLLCVLGFIALFFYFFFFYFNSPWFKDLQIYLDAARQFRAGVNPYWFSHAGYGDNFVYPPYAIPFFLLWSMLPDTWVRLLWIFSVAAGYISVGYPLFIVEGGKGRLLPAAVVCGLAVLFAPFFETVALGQIDPFILYSLLFFLYAYDHRNPYVTVLSEILLIAVAGIKIVPLVVLIVPLFQGRITKIVRCAVIGAVWAVVMTGITGLDVWRQYLATFTDITQSTVIGNTVISAAAAIDQILKVLRFPYKANVLLQYLDNAVIGCTFAFLVWIVWRFRKQPEATTDLVFLVIGLFVTVSKLPWFYHLGYLLPLLARNFYTEDGKPDPILVAGLFIIQLSPLIVHAAGISILATTGYYLIIGHSVARFIRRDE